MSKLFKTLLQNKKTLVLIMGLGLFLSLIPLHFAQALFWDTVLDALNYIATFPLRLFASGCALLIGLIGFISGLFFSLATVITNWIVQATLSVGISPSNNLTPDIIRIGWNFTRDFANMFFILILVFIGLATILKLQEYQAKKTLPLLIIIALLINFSPVLVSFIVDISNIFTNFFIERVGELNNLLEIKNLFDGYFHTATVGIFSETGMDFGELLGVLTGIIIYGIVLVVFYTFGAIVYFFVTILFIARIVFLWMLMILAPIAFLSYIFPATKKLYLIGWDSWWEQLIKWSILGIPIGFFLYLSSYIINIPIESIFGSTPNLVGEIGHLGAFFTKALAPIVGLIFLFEGVKFARKLAPEAALKIVDGVKKAAKVVAISAVAAATLGAGAAGVAGVAGKAAAGAAKVDAVLGKRRLTKPLQYLVGKPAKWATRGVERTVAPRLLEYAAETEKARLPQNFRGWSADKQDKWIRASMTTPDSRLRASYTMGENLKYISPELRNTLKGDALKRSKKLELQKEVENYRKYFPGDSTEEMHVNVKMATKITKEEKEKAKKDAIKEIDEMADEMKEKAKADLEFKIEILNKVEKRGFKRDSEEGFERVVRDMAAGAILSEKIKRKDVDKVADPESVEFRWGMRGQTSSVYQGLVENFDKDKIQNILNGVGSINRDFELQKDNSEKQKELLVDLHMKNEALLRWLFTSPVGKAWNFSGREIMDKPIEKGGYGNYDNFLKTARPKVEARLKEKEKKHKEAEEKKKAEETEKTKKKKREKGPPQTFKSD